MGYVTPSERRVHVTNPRLWAESAGTDFWAFFGPEVVTPSGLLEAPLSDYGWTTTSLAETAGTGADFLSTSDRSSPAHVLTDASGDLLQSPAIFGDYGHAQMAAGILGYQPTQMLCEFYGSMTVHSADETRSGWGLVEAGGTAGTDADAMAWVRTDGTNFIIRSAADADTGALDDASWHVFRVAFSNAVAAGTDMVEWFIDGTSQGTMDLQTDLFPVSFGMHALTTNRPAIAWVHIWYA